MRIIIPRIAKKKRRMGVVSFTLSISPTSPPFGPNPLKYVTEANTKFWTDLNLPLSEVEK